MTVSDPNNPSERPGDRSTQGSSSPEHHSICNEVVFHPRRATRKLRQDPEFMHLREEYEEIHRLGGPGGETAALRWLVAAYETAVEERVRRGERLRSVLLASGPALAPGDDVLHDYLVRVAENPAHAVPLLGSMYASALAEEERFAALVELAVMDHPVWPWLSSISGIGAILAARLLSRLDITRARTPSSFWKYCGLATVPGTLYECARCGTLISGMAGMRHTPFHRSGDGARCDGGAAIGTTRTVNIAEPRPRAGESRSYDATARMACHLIGVSFARRGIGYKELYKARAGSLTEHHPEWPPKRIYLAAQRATVKRFLADLWGEWRRVAGLPVVHAYSLHTRRERGRDARPAATEDRGDRQHPSVLVLQ
jgi:hypothetical protein